MITVCLYGELRSYGRRFPMHVDSPAEALRGLFTQIKGLREAVRQGLFQVRFNKRDYTEDEVKESFGEKASGVLHIVPRAAGAGKNGGVIQVIVGIVLIVVSIWFPPAGVAAGSIWGTGFMMGMSLLLGGISTLMTKPPEMGLGKGAKDGHNSAFSNLSNTAGQGLPIPLAYGLCYCGSRVVSQGISSRRVPADIDKQVEQSGNRPGQGKGWFAAGMPARIDAHVHHIPGQAAVSPDGRIYRTDFTDESVRQANHKKNLRYVAIGGGASWRGREHGGRYSDGNMGEIGDRGEGWGPDNGKDWSPGGNMRGGDPGGGLFGRDTGNEADGDGGRDTGGGLFGGRDGGGSGGGSGGDTTGSLF
ncbi:hypothetical protein V9W64_10925 [Neisseria leonii]|uniref:Tail assembly protein n=1 Tax=Neisseria leonii TaxID=2995413 RepID=A0A9X4I9V6_9NEIS|nr:hypothetical protein [Neisseria sp. 51.81]MDD9326755.1 hypothetical protein [Neisseria sp. 51.81]